MILMTVGDISAKATIESANRSSTKTGNQDARQSRRSAGSGIEKDRDKLKHPPQSAPKRWQKINDSLSELTREVTGQDRFAPETPAQNLGEDS